MLMVHRGYQKELGGGGDEKCPNLGDKKETQGDRGQGSPIFRRREKRFLAGNRGFGGKKRKARNTERIMLMRRKKERGKEKRVKQSQK